MSQPPLRIIGPSSDRRTNRWEITCLKCGKPFVPATTMFSKDLVECPRQSCGAQMLADYNAEPPTLKLRD
jgi:DNA-directed RNA polymerase subunit RPC12/RpoP